MTMIYHDSAGKQWWCCKWSDKTFAALNAMKAIRHLNKIAKDIRLCLAIIDKVHQEKYADFLKTLQKKRNRGRLTKNYIEQSIDSYKVVRPTRIKRKKSMISDVHVLYLYLTKATVLLQAKSLPNQISSKNVILSQFQQPQQV